MFNEDRTGAGNLLTFFFGIAVGVVGTLVYAAANEDQFRRAVGRTKELAGNAKDTVGDYVDDAHTKLKKVSDQAHDSIGGAIAKVKGKASDVAEQIEDGAKQAQKELNS